MKKKFINPENMPKSVGFTQVVETSNSKTIYISGQCSIDEEGQIVGINDISNQTKQVFDNLEKALKSVSLKFDNIVKLTFYVTDFTQMPSVRIVRDQYINANKPPAITAVEVNRLVNEDFLIEVEAIATSN